MISYKSLILVSLLMLKVFATRQTFFALSGVFDVNLNSCNDSSTLPGSGILVTHGLPSHDGSVLIKSMLNKTLRGSNPLCNWTYEVNNVSNMVQGKLAAGSNTSRIFSKLGLQKVLVTAKFKYTGKPKKITNCTFVNVTDCDIEPKITVLTPERSYNITQNHTDVTLDSPGLVNFTVRVIKIDPYFICKQLYFNWTFGDGYSAVGNHVYHCYNKTGVYSVVLNLFKDFNDAGREFVRNITLKVHVKEKDVPTNGMNTVIDVSLVLAILFGCSMFVVCTAVCWYRRRFHRHTEVARFDFRATELQSSFDGHCISRPHGKRVRCTNPMSCRRGSNENLLNFAHYNEYSSINGDIPDE